MSRRTNPGADKIAANQAVIKNLLKLPGNRVCADCKRNKLPRWASWNLGIFVCIRCSGIHRGMGTHISRVKSVDLDSWTDEQLQSMVKWGNSRANKYWEANLAPGHVPSEAKIENFIRTKYEAKRWVMEGGLPDPSTLDDSDDDNVPLKEVQKKLERRSSPAAAAPPPPPAQVNLFDDFEPAIQSTSSLPPTTSSSPKPSNNNNKPPPTNESLLGLDFFAPVTNPSPRPQSVNSDPGKMASASSRPDLNRSILSLYASAPRPQPKPQSPTMPSFQPQMQQHSSAFGDLSDSFGGLNFNTQAQAAPPKPSPFANLTSGMKKTGAAPHLSTQAPLSGGFFASTKTASTPAPAPAPLSSGLGDLFDFGAPAVPSAPVSSTTSTANNAMGSLTFDTDVWSTPSATTSTAASNNNAWATTTVPSTQTTASNNAWATSGPTSSSNAWGSSAPMTKPAPPSYVNNDEEDWGNFSSGTTSTAAPVKVNTSSGLDDDLFGNVWK